VPIQVVSLSNVARITAGTNHVVAVKSDGSVWSWGDNAGGQLGDGTRDRRFAPVRVPNLPTVERVWCGNGGCVARTTGAKAWAWGVPWGQFGPAGVPVDAPFPVPLFDGFVSFAVGFGPTVGIDAAGRAWVWGPNSR